MMSKKILSLVLAALMLVLAVPVMAVAAEAEEPVYSTSFGIVNNEPKNCTNLPTIDDAGNVTYYGNWTPIVYNKGAYSMPDAVMIMDAKNNNIDGSIGPAGAVGGGGTAGMKIAGQALGGNTTYWAYYGQVFSTSSCSAGVRYTAEKSGTISIVLDAIGKMARLGRSSAEFRYGIFLNGEMIWPVSDGTALGDTQPLHELFEGVTGYEDISTDWPITPDGVGAEVYLDVEAISSLFVLEGDVLDFVVEMVSSDGQWYGMWEGQGNVFFPTINYTSLLKETEMTAAVTLDQGFGVALGFAVLDPIYTNIRVKVNGETLDVNEEGKYVYNDIAPKEIGEELDYQATGSLNGKAVLLAEGTLKISDLLYTGYVKDKEDSATRRLAIAALNYGAAAQQYFKGMTRDLANERLTAAEKTVTLENTYDDRAVLVAAKENEIVKLETASLLLNDTVDVKFVVTTNKNIDNYRLQVSANADFTDATELAFAKCKKGRQEVPYNFKAIVEDIAPGAWDDVIYVRVIDKTNGDAVVSKTVRYSAAIYYARNGGAENALLTAMLAVNEAAAAYAAE